MQTISGRGAGHESRSQVVLAVGWDATTDWVVMRFGPQVLRYGLQVRVTSVPVESMQVWVAAVAWVHGSVLGLKSQIGSNLDPSDPFFFTRLTTQFFNEFSRILSFSPDSRHNFSTNFLSPFATVSDICSLPFSLAISLSTSPPLSPRSFVAGERP